MNKWSYFLLGLFWGLYLGFILTIMNIQIDGVNELDNGVITLKIFNNYFDYEYKYNEIEKEVIQ